MSNSGTNTSPTSVGPSLAGLPLAGLPLAGLPLAGLRVVDAASRTAPHCGQLLALFGADVVIVNPPKDHAEDHQWLAFNLGKRTGDAPLAALAADADVLIEGDDPVRGYRPIEQNPALIHCVITPFGSSGPRSTWRATELIGQASGGILYLSGDKAFPPAQLGFPLALSMTGAQAATGVMLALARRSRSGVGSVLDVSQQEAVANLLFTTQFMSYVLGQPGQHGEAPLTQSDEKLTRKVLWRCQDGYVTWTLWTGPGLGEKNLDTFSWMKERGVTEADELMAVPWPKMSTGDLTAPLVDLVKRTVGNFFASMTREEISRESRARRLMLYTVEGPAEVLQNEQLRARDAFRTVTSAGPVSFEIVATPVRSTAYAVEIPTWVPSARPANAAPVDTSDSTVAAQPPLASRISPTELSNGAALPLSGVRVLDLGWAIVSPLTTKCLSIFGAEVVKLEYRKRPDPTRMTGPYPLGRPSMDGGAAFVSVNATKRSMGIDLAHPEAHKIVMRMAQKADLVCENFAPGVAARLGYGFDAFHAVKPDTVMLSLSMQGQTGPRAELPGLGNHLQAMSGIDYLTGFPEGPPGGPNQVMPDFIGPWLATVAVLAAFEHRRRTGAGQYLDISQLEAMFMYLQPQLIAQQTSGVSPERAGNTSPVHAPHGVYPAIGHDRWIAIAVCSDEQWRALWEMLPSDLRSGYSQTMSCGERLSNRHVLDVMLAKWTARQDGGDLAAQLQVGGIAAYPVNDGLQMIADPQLAHRGHYRHVQHPKLGDQLVDLPAFRFADLDPLITPGPTYADDTVEVLQEWLNITDEELAALVASGALDF